MVKEAPAAPPVKLTLKERLSAHTAEYGKIAIYTYLVMSLATITGFSIAIGAGIEPSSASGVLGVIGAGWLAAKATMPIRILITLGLTPAIAAIITRVRRKRVTPVAVADVADASASASESAS
ncbi:MAG: hypothetical protein NT062_18780 [Proteobacteria bacterium]|nr:hypothetical protein [Pseudomonadota bacterium]